MDSLRELYQELLEYNPFSFRTIGGQKAFLKIFTEIEKVQQRLLKDKQNDEENLDFFSIENCRVDTEENKSATKTRGNRYIENAKKVKAYNLETGAIVACDKYVYGYQDLSFEQFCSYIYWRTQIRNQKYYEAPVAYLCLYLIELCNFVEFDTVEDTCNQFKKLAANLEGEKHKQQVCQAMSDFFNLYGTVHTILPYDNSKYQFEHIKECVAYLERTHKNPFDFIVSRATHKIKKCSIYQENPALVEERFLAFFTDMLKLFEENGIDFVKCWVGKCVLEKTHLSYAIKEIDYDRVVEKKLIEDGIVLREVNKNGVFEARMESQGQNVDPGQCVFSRSYIINYPIRVFENELRKKMGKRQLKVSTKDIQSMLEHGEKPLLRKILEVYESEAFANCVKESVENI